VKRTIIGIPVFVFIVMILLGVLQILNWIPSAVQEGAFRRFESIDEVRSHLKIHPLLVPVYYPSSVQWPPSLIAAQTRPYTAVVMEFLNSGSGDTGLVITQTALSHQPIEEKIRFTVVRETVRYAVKGRTALLEVGTCGNGERCSRISWDEGAYRMSVVMKASPVDLVRIAESMIVDRHDDGPDKSKEKH
jgi:hypothetical protein